MTYRFRRWQPSVLPSHNMANKLDLLTLTAVELQRLLTDGSVTSEEVVELYLAQIEKHNHVGLKLNAVISTADRDFLRRRARQLDDERKQGKTRGPLHGVPMLIKDICATVDMPTTCGAHAMLAGKTKKDAPIIGTLNDAGLIILGKTNLTELGSLKGLNIMGGWSAVGGQTQTPYVKGGVADGAPFYSHTCPGGSSSGSAVGVAAGFAPLSIGTEVDGSITHPAARAGLYALKLTPETVDNTGFQPGVSGWSSQGPFARSTSDVATLSAIMQLHDPGYYHPLPTAWDGLRVGFVDPSLWRLGSPAAEDVDGYFEQTDAALLAAAEKIKMLGGKVVMSVPLASWETIASAVPDYDEIADLFAFQIKRRFPEFLALFEGVPQSIEEFIQFNKDHADIVFTERDNNQLGLEISRDDTTTQEVHDRNAKAMRESSAGAINRMLEEYGVDVLFGPGDSLFASVAAAAGFPVGNFPLGFAHFNGRPFGLHGTAVDERKVLAVMSAWEATFPENVRRPPLLVEYES
ncbi:amidase signature domain-containing protein [Podospora didyma]|uniref:Amidase signature domain-containing protein n=1 Tax=Podospora didyma TaxID=330526 RepID=A0AAE0NX93_9PEZI|nr:amidase signature domain-containing protein [Podospora didyma]